MNLRTPLVFMVLLFQVTGCGFHLRGTSGASLDLDAIAVIASSRVADIEDEVVRTLSQAGADIRSPSEAPYTLELLSEQLQRRPIGTSGQISVSELELQLVLQFRVLDKSGAPLLAETSLSVERIYSFDNTSLVGNSAEEELLIREMRRDLASQLVRRVSAAIAPGDQTR
ncbi:MAG: LPS assembly lipoprotein LptE [Pseudomonadota bacterium]